MPSAEITGWGKALPPSVLSNADLEKIVDTDDEWIMSRSGIKERRISHVPATDMAEVAARRAMAAAGIEADDVDLIVNATCTPESIIPASASYVQAKLGATNAGAMDVNANCSGFIYGYVTVDSMVRSGAVKTAVLIGVERMSWVVDYTDRGTCILFGDGAGAVVVQASENETGIVSSHLGVDGTMADILCVPNDGTIEPGSATSATKIHMDGSDVFRRAVTEMADASELVVKKAGWDLDEIDLLVPHQANRRIIDATARRLKLDTDRVFLNVHAYGNTSSATIPIALTEAIEAGRVPPNANLVFAAFGGGLTWAAAAVKFGARVHPLGEAGVELPGTDQTVWDLLQPNFEYYGRLERSMSRVVLVTGASRGIGRSVALDLAGRGHAVAINYASRADAADEVVSMISDAGGTAASFAADVSKADDVTRLFAEVETMFGRPEILVNNAGITEDDLLLRLDEEKWDRVMDVNLKSAFFCSKAALKGMLRARWGRIVSVSSVAGVHGNAGQTNYAASKAGLIGFSKSLAKEVGSRGITVNVVAPGFIETDLTDGLHDDIADKIRSSTSLGRLGQPGEISSAVGYLSSDEASYITGQVLLVDGGLAL